MQKRDWQNVFGEPPADFRRQLRRTLDGLEEEKMKKQTKFTTVLIAALVAALVLAGGAIAASRLGVFGMLSRTADPIAPLDGAAAMVQSNLGSAENDLVTLMVEEAVYDGQGALVQLRLTPKDPARFALLNLLYQDAPEDEYILEERFVPVTEDVDEARYCEWLGVTPEEAFFEKDGVKYFANQADLAVLGRRDGKAVISYDIDAELTGGEDWDVDPTNYLDRWDGEAQPDGSVILWGSGFSETPMGDAMALSVGCSVSADGEDAATGDNALRLPEIPVTLVKSEAERRATLVPQADSDLFRVRSATLTFTKVRGYLTVDYDLLTDRGGEMGIDFTLRDADGHDLPCEGGCAHCETSADGTQRWRWVNGVQSLDAMPETLLLVPKVVGENEPLPAVPCRVSED